MYFHEVKGDELLRSALMVRVREGLGVSHRELLYLMCCAAKGQFYFATSEKNELIGYVAYALVTKYTLNMLAKNCDLVLRREEFDEGHIFLIVDLVVAKDHARRALSILKFAVRKRRLICGYRNAQFKIFRRGKFSYRNLSLDVVSRLGPDGLPKAYFSFCDPPRV